MFKYTLEDHIQSNVTVDDLISEEGLKEIGNGLIAKLKVWLRKLHIWISSLFNKKEEDIKNTPANVLKEATKNIESPVKGENISEDEVWQPRGHHHLVSGIKKYLFKRAHGEPIDDYTKNQYDEFVRKLKDPNLAKVPVIGLKGWYKLVSAELADMSKNVDEIADAFRYIDLGDYPDCKDGIVAAQRMLMVYIRILKYYDEILDYANSDMYIYSKLPEDLQNVLIGHVTRNFRFTKSAVETILGEYCMGDTVKYNHTMVMIYKLSDGKYADTCKDGDVVDGKRMRPAEELAPGVRVRVVLHGLLNTGTGQVIYPAKVVDINSKRR